ncbi:MAG: DoxX family membrane protein, partial [Candidatus Nanohaloarchaea archaeon]|nr:DoxX family membrane protein [Candidatus Nanohaloarchaea archaeon]
LKTFEHHLLAMSYLKDFRSFLHNHSEFSFTALRWGLGVMMFLAGLHKLFEPAIWAAYTAPELTVLFPGTPTQMMQFLHAPVEIIAGLAILADFYTDVAASISALSLLGIIFNLLLAGGPVDTLIRDIGLFGLALSAAFMFGDSVQEDLQNSS